MNIALRLRALWREVEGQDLLEYALLASLIALVAYGAVEVTGTSVNTLFESIASTAGTAAGVGGGA